MDESVFNHLLYRIANAPIRTYPFTHFFIEEVFPADFYQEMLAQFPDTSHFKNLVEMGNANPGTYEKRLVLPLKPNDLGHLPFNQLLFWSQLSQAFLQEAWRKTLLDKFHNEIRNRFSGHYLNTAFYSQIELLSDGSEYAIGPHTDHPRRVLTLLFYLPSSNDQPHLGTSLYRPNDPYYKCEGLKHHSFDAFTKVFTAPFIPNSVLGFIKSDNSFHGVESLGKQEIPRRLLNYTLCWAPPESIL
jgi:hypothetical protein